MCLNHRHEVYTSYPLFSSAFLSSPFLSSPSFPYSSPLLYPPSSYNAGRNLKSSLLFGIGLKCGLSGTLPSGQASKKSSLTGREIYMYLPKQLEEVFRALLLSSQQLSPPTLYSHLPSLSTFFPPSPLSLFLSVSSFFHPCFPLN